MVANVSKFVLMVDALTVSVQADQICYAVLCLFSYIAAGMEQRKQS